MGEFKPTPEEVKVVSDAALELAKAAVEDGLMPLLLHNGYNEDEAKGFVSGLEIGVAVGQMHHIWAFWMGETLELWHESHGDEEPIDAPTVAQEIVNHMMAASRESKTSEKQKTALGLAIKHLIPTKERSDA
jgi:hypothetical protein